MLHDSRIPTCCLIALLLTATACSTGNGPESTAPATKTDARPPMQNESQAITLRTAMIPGDEPQLVRIQLDESRETMGDTAGTTRHELHLDLTATLSRDKVRDSGEVEAKLAFKRIKLTLGMPDRPESMLHYDSSANEQDPQNPLAGIMKHVANAELSLVVGPSGRLRELHGLDACWGRAKLIMVPPRLLTAQWLFRDIGMRELVSEALFPPMPASPIRPGDAWEIDLPANVTLVARLNAHLRNELAQLDSDGSGVTIRATGDIAPSAEPLPGGPPAIRPTVKSGTVTVEQTVEPGSHALTQHKQRRLEMDLTMIPPTGDERPQMTIKQIRTLASQRGPGAESVKPGS